MKLTVFGATGRTGHLLVQRALDSGHHVTAVVRDPARKDTSNISSLAIGAIVEAMGATGVRRVAALSAQPVLRSGAGEPRRALDVLGDPATTRHAIGVAGPAGR